MTSSGWLMAILAAPGRSRPRRRPALARGVSAQCTLLAAPGPVLRCNQSAVGVLVTGPGGRVLLAGPAGIPCARHLAAGHDHAVAARAVAARDCAGGVALALTGAGGWRADRCERGRGPDAAGHRWHIYVAAVAGPLDLTGSPVPAAQWIGRGELQELAEWAVACACGQLPDGGSAIAPVWVGFLAQLGLIALSPWALTAADYRARTRQPITSRVISVAGPPALAAGRGTRPHQAAAGWRR